MNRRAFFATVVGVAVTGSDVGAQSGVHLEGTFGGPDVEAGFFELTNADGKSEGDLLIATKPDSPLYPQLKALNHLHVQVSIFRPG